MLLTAQSSTLEQHFHVAEKQTTMHTYYRNMLVQLSIDHIQQQPTCTHLVTNDCSAQQRSDFCFLTRKGGFHTADNGKVSFWNSHLFLDSVCITSMMTLGGYLRQVVISLLLNIILLSRIRACHTHEETLSLFPLSSTEKLCWFMSCLCSSPSTAGSVVRGGEALVKMTHKSLSMQLLFHTLLTKFWEDFIAGSYKAYCYYKLVIFTEYLLLGFCNY